MGDLFEEAAGRRLETAAPLAQRLRPSDARRASSARSTSSGPGRALRLAIEADRVPSLVLYGPPGTGQDDAGADRRRRRPAPSSRSSRPSRRPSRTCARCSARARERLGATGRRTILFLDEIHRFNKAQQDALLPGVEDGLVTLIGATTENPYFELNSALLSRMQVYELEPLTRERAARDRPPRRARSSASSSTRRSRS